MPLSNMITYSQLKINEEISEFEIRHVYGWDRPLPGADPVQEIIARLRSHGCDPRSTGSDQWEARCPVHRGRRHNLTISRGADGRVLLYCHHADENGEPSCTFEEIVSVVGLTPAELFVDSRPERSYRIPPTVTKPKTQAKPAYTTAAQAIEALRLGEPKAVWSYHDVGGQEIAQVVRYDLLDGKTYRPIHYSAGVGWQIGDPPGLWPLYRLHELADADLMYVLEGEKCADLARSLGLVATTTAHGAGSPHKSDLEPLAGKSVIIVPDHDEAGAGYAQALVKLLAALEPRPQVKLVRLPGLEEGGDIEQWLANQDPWDDQQPRAALEALVAAETWIDLATEEQPGAESLDGLRGFLENPPPLRPITIPLRPVPPMVPELIPEPFRDWLTDIATRASCPLDLPVVAAMVSVAAVVGRQVAIRPKRYDDWTVVPNLWGVGVLPPGWLKTHCLEEPKKPLARLEVEAREQYEKEKKEFIITKAVAEATAKSAKAALEAACKKKESLEIQRKHAAEAMAEHHLTEPTLRRYVINDVTVEKLGELLAENPNGILMYRDELMGFLKNLEKTGHESDRAFYLEAWDGTKSYSYDRIGRGTLFIPSTTISILGGIQPGRLASYIRKSGSGEDDDGFISRFQLAVYPDTDLPFRNVDRWPETEAKNRAYAVFKALAHLDPLNIGAKQDEYGAIGVPYLRFADDAQSFFDEWRTELEKRIRNSKESANIISHLGKYRSLQPSLSLIFHLIEVVGGKANGLVSLQSAQRASAWCSFLESHALRIYAAAFDGDPEPAQRLTERLQASLPNPFTPYQVVQKGWKSLDTIETVNKAIAMAEEHGWLYRDETTPGPKGGRPKIEIHLNPRLGEKTTEEREERVN